MLSIGALASPGQGAGYYERDGYYAKDDPEHKSASSWAGKGAEELGLEGPVDADVFRAVLEGRVPDGSGRQLGRRGKDGEVLHRPGRDLTFSAPKSVSIAALVGGDARVVDAHDRAVKATLAWVERNAAETRVQDAATGRMVRVRGQEIVAATFQGPVEVDETYMGGKERNKHAKRSITPSKSTWTAKPTPTASSPSGPC